MNKEEEGRARENPRRRHCSVFARQRPTVAARGREEAGGGEIGFPCVASERDARVWKETRRVFFHWVVTPLASFGCEGERNQWRGSDRSNRTAGCRRLGPPPPSIFGGACSVSQKPQVTVEKKRKPPTLHSSRRRQSNGGSRRRQGARARRRRQWTPQTSYLSSSTRDRSLRCNRPYGGLPSLPSEDSPQMAFLDAAIQGDVPRLRELASGRDAEGMAWLADVYIVGGGPLQTAARMGNLDAVRCMVEELGFDVNGGTQSGATSLSAAAVDERMHVMRYLLDQGADLNKLSNSGHAPLHHAAKYGRDEAAQLLLSRGASVDIAFLGLTPLHFAASFGKIRVMKVLLEHHADPNKVSEEGSTPLTETLCATDVSESVALKCVKLLVEAGTDLNSANIKTPLVVATSYGLTDCVKYLLKAGADPNIPHIHCGAKPIELAATRGRRKLVELLFPLTSPIRTVPNWTVEGIIAHANSRPSKPKVKHDKNTKVQLKSYGEKAIKRKDYHGASMFYTEAIELDPTDATLVFK